MTSPVDTFLDRVDWRCTRCNAKPDTCTCWERCTCGWSIVRGSREFCRNPATKRCSGKVMYGKWCSRCREWHALGAFAADVGKRGGLASSCRASVEAAHAR